MERVASWAGTTLCEKSVYVSWEEVPVSSDKGRREVHYLLKRRGGAADLAVVGKEKTLRHMSYRYAIRNPSLGPYVKLKSRREVVDWLDSVVSVYQPFARAKGLNTEEAIRISKPTSMLQEHLNISTMGRVSLSRANSQKAAMNGEVGDGNYAKKQDTGFSLFHFGGPADLSTCHKLPNASSNVGDFNKKSFVDEVQNENETSVMEEYNLFAGSKSLRFSIF